MDENDLIGLSCLNTVRNGTKRGLEEFDPKTLAKRSRVNHDVDAARI